MDHTGIGAHLDLCDKRGLVPALALFYLVFWPAGSGAGRRDARAGLDTGRGAVALRGAGPGFPCRPPGPVAAPRAGPVSSPAAPGTSRPWLAPSGRWAVEAG